MFFIGTTGFNHPSWRQIFYPPDLNDSDYLVYFSNHFNALELTETRFKLPDTKQLDNLIVKTGGRVQFSLFAPWIMTHKRVVSDFDFAAFNKILSILKEADVLGAVLLQFPHSFEQNETGRHYLLHLADSINGPLVAEFATREWSTPSVLSWLKKINIGYCCVDAPNLEALMPRKAVATATPAYVRFNGRNGRQWFYHDHIDQRYSYFYSMRELQEWAPLIERLQSRAQMVFVFFNNYYKAGAVDSAHKMKRLLLRPSFLNGY
jgi:uncharacterized protein YecE (DUF72 family)